MSAPCTVLWRLAAGLISTPVGKLSVEFSIRARLRREPNARIVIASASSESGQTPVVRR